MYNQIVILAQGGSHGDFLTQCLKIAEGEQTPIVTESGEVVSFSKFKSFKTPSIPKEKFWLSHIWHKVMSTWPSKFFYIHIEPENIPITIEMYVAKVFNGDKDKFLNYWRKEYAPEISRHITKENFYEVYSRLYTVAQERFKSNAEPIAMTDLYDYNKLVEFLQKQNVYNSKNASKLTAFYNDWYSKNTNYINKITNKY